MTRCFFILCFFVSGFCNDEFSQSGVEKYCFSSDQKYDVFSILRPKIKIAVVTAAIGEKYYDITSKAIENKKQYCAKHGYDFYLIKSDLQNSFGVFAEKKRHPAWSKVVMVLHLLKNYDYDWVFWTDADSLIMNMGTKLEELIELAGDKQFIASRVISTNINMGQFLVKKGIWSVDLLNRAWQSGEIYALKWPNGGVDFAEEMHIVTQLQKDFDKLLLVPASKLNAQIKNFQDGDFMIHFIGMNGEPLRDQIENYEKRVQAK